MNKLIIIIIILIIIILSISVIVYSKNILTEKFTVNTSVVSFKNKYGLYLTESGNNVVQSQLLNGNNNQSWIINTDGSIQSVSNQLYLTATGNHSKIYLSENPSKWKYNNSRKTIDSISYPTQVIGIAADSKQINTVNVMLWEFVNINTQLWEQITTVNTPGPWIISYSEKDKNFLPLRIGSNGKIECMSTDNKNCFWGKSNVVSPSNLNPVNCSGNFSSWCDISTLGNTNTMTVYIQNNNGLYLTEQNNQLVQNIELPSINKSKQLWVYDKTHNTFKSLSNNMYIATYGLHSKVYLTNNIDDNIQWKYTNNNIYNIKYPTQVIGSASDSAVTGITNLMLWENVNINSQKWNIFTENEKIKLEAAKQAAINEAARQAAITEAAKQAAINESARQAAITEAAKQAAINEAARQAAITEAAKQAALAEEVRKASIEAAKKEAESWKLSYDSNGNTLPLRIGNNGKNECMTKDGTNCAYGSSVVDVWKAKPLNCANTNADWCDSIIGGPRTLSLKDKNSNISEWQCITSNPEKANTSTSSYILARRNKYPSWGNPNLDIIECGAPTLSKPCQWSKGKLACEKLSKEGVVAKFSSDVPVSSNAASWIKQAYTNAIFSSSNDIKLVLNFEDIFTNLDNWVAKTDYTKYADRYPENAVIDKDGLHLQNKKNKPGTVAPYSCATIWSKKKFGYGYYECRYKYSNADGINNAFWLVCDSYNWTNPVTGELRNRGDEIDINEGHYPNEIAMTIHQWIHSTPTKPYENNITTQEHATRGSNLANEYHNYGFLYTKNVLKWYIDGIEIHSFDNTNPKTLIKFSPMEIRLSTLVVPFAGKMTDKIIGTSMDVKYVRYYTIK